MYQGHISIFTDIRYGQHIPEHGFPDIKHDSALSGLPRPAIQPVQGKHPVVLAVVFRIRHLKNRIIVKKAPVIDGLIVFIPCVIVKIYLYRYIPAPVHPEPPVIKINDHGIQKRPG